MELSSTKLIKYFESQNIKTAAYGNVKAVPVFSSLENELEILTNGAALRVLFNYSLIELKGKDSLDFLHRVTTNSIKDLKKEEVTQTIFTSEKGRILSLATILNFESYQFMIVGSSNKARVISWINKYIIADDVKVSDADDRFNLLELSGAQSDSFITLVCSNVVNDLKPNSFNVISTEGILFFLVKLIDFNGRNKYWILAEQDNSVKLLEYMKGNSSLFNFGFIGEDAYQEYRVRMGIPAAPNELNDQFNPHEAGIINLVDFKKGCYIGQEVIARIDTYDKVQKYLTGVNFQDPVETNQHFVLFDEEDKEVGVVTSAVKSNKFNRSIGLAYIRKNFSQPGTVLTAKNNEIITKVTTQDLPFLK